MTQHSKRLRRSAGSADDADVDTSMESSTSNDASPEVHGADVSAMMAAGAGASASRSRKRKAEDLDSDDELAIPAAKPRRSLARRAAAVDALCEADGVAAADDEEQTDEEAEMDASSTEPAAGIIEQIELTDFMNHRHYKIDFCEGVNFVHGANGAGKSAFLHALQVCLGARASVTHRGNRLADFIRRGSRNQEAVVRVVLRNTGPEAFQPEKFGRRIIIERKIRPTSSLLSIRASNGREISKTKRDLSEILDNLNILVDNPVCVLTQEDSKLFLKGNNKKKFDFFMKATELDRIQSAILDTMALIESKRVDLQRAETRLPVMKENMKRAKSDLSEAEVFLKTDIKVARLDCQARWADIRVLHHRMQQNNARVGELRFQLDQLAALSAKSEADTHTEQLRCQEFERILDEATSGRDAADDQLQQLGAQRAALMKPISIAANAVRHLEQKRVVVQRELHHAQGELNAMRSEAAAAASKDQANIMDQITDAEASVNEMVEMEKQWRQQKQSVEEESRRVEDTLREQQKRRSELRTERERDVDELQQLQNSSGSAVSRLGRGADSLFRAVEKARREGRFQGEVLGPLGVHIQLRDDKASWAEGVEASIRMYFGDYVVTNKADRRILMGINNTFRERMKVHTLPPRALGQRWQANAADVARFGCFSVDDCITVESNIVWNVLQSKGRIQNVFLFQDEHVLDASGIVGQGNRLPQGVTGFRLADGTQVQFSAGSRRRLPTDNRNRVLGVDASAQRAAIAERIDALGREIAEVDNDMRAQERLGGATARSEISDLDKRITKSVKQRKRLSQKKEKLAAELTELEDASAIDTSEVERRVSDAEHDLHALATEVGVAQQHHQEQLMHLGPVEECIAIAQEHLRAHAHEVEVRGHALGNAVHAAETQRHDTAKLAKLYPKKQKEYEHVCHALEQEKHHLDTQVNHLRDYELQRIGESVEATSTKTRPVYEAKQHNLLKMKEQLMRKKGMDSFDLDELQQRYDHHKGLYESAKERIDSVKAAVEDLGASLKGRKERWVTMRKRTTRATSKAFDRILNKKGHSGGIDLDIKSGELGITVQKDNTDANTQVTDVRLLSGGERSFSTLALLVGLGKVVECPFRLMDEFDVFMDAVSRNTSMETLLAMANDHPNKQFIFITPQSLNMIHQHDRCKVWEIAKDASGGMQTTLDDFVDAA